MVPMESYREKNVMGEKNVIHSVTHICVNDAAVLAFQDVTAHKDVQ